VFTHTHLRTYQQYTRGWRSHPSSSKSLTVRPYPYFISYWMSFTECDSSGWNWVPEYEVWYQLWFNSCLLLSGAWGSVVVKALPTSRTDPGSIPGGVTGFFRDIFPSDRTMALGSTQTLVKMSTRSIPSGKDGRCVRLTTSPPMCRMSWNLGA
jgi:hypothetical protein